MHGTEITTIDHHQTIDAIKKSDRVSKEASDEQRDSLSKCTMQEIFKSPCLCTIDFMLSHKNTKPLKLLIRKYDKMIYFLINIFRNTPIKAVIIDTKSFHRQQFAFIFRMRII